MTADSTRVLILMALYNAGAHLAAQLDSFAAQDHADWGLLASDDGATDGSDAVVRAFAAAHPDRDIRQVAGPRRGFARNFLHLLVAAGPDVPMVALSDHDDVWFPEKLSRAVATLRDAPQDRPVLYCARTIVAGPALEPRGPSPVWPRPFGFGNALVQNVAAGNTIVLNRAALTLAQTAALRLAEDTTRIVAHDWWLYQIVTGAGGLVLRDNHPVLLYRQHQGNAMGRNDTVAARLARVRKLLSGEFSGWNSDNIAVLDQLSDLFTPAARAQLAAFGTLRGGNLPARLKALKASGVYRQTGPADLALRLSALAGRL